MGAISYARGMAALVRLFSSCSNVKYPAVRSLHPLICLAHSSVVDPSSKPPSKRRPCCMNRNYWRICAGDVVYDIDREGVEAL